MRKTQNTHTSLSTQIISFDVSQQAPECISVPALNGSLTAGFCEIRSLHARKEIILPASMSWATQVSNNELRKIILICGFMSHLYSLLCSTLHLCKQCTHLCGRDIWAWRRTVTNVCHSYKLIEINFLWHFIKRAYITMEKYWWREFYFFKVCHPCCVCNSLGGRRIVKTTQLIRKKGLF